MVVKYEERPVPSLHCGKCGHTWYAQRPQRPVVCPRCKSYKWDESKPEEKLQEVANANR